MVYIDRIMNLDLPPRQSAFLWGPRKTGKSTFLKSRFPSSLVYDFLKTDLYFEFSSRPFLLREQLLAKGNAAIEHPVILDEVQKVPRILDEIHWLIENKGLQFILCGSSARKLRKGKVNLLGGRAWRYEMHPFVSAELKELDLLRILNRGMIPDHYLQANYRKSLKAYVQDYLKEEVFNEGLTRNLPAFSRFFEAVGYSHGELINYTNIARDCGVSSKTAKEYFQILHDTLVGRFVAPYKKRQSRQVIGKAPKFYLFDVGVAGAITGRNLDTERGEAFGRAFEHFIFMELVAYRSYQDLDFEINFWRTKDGLEVDFVLGGGDVAIEVKSTARIERKDLNPLTVFKRECAPQKAILVCNEREKRIHEKICITPYKDFLKDLWAGRIIS